MLGRLAPFAMAATLGGPVFSPPRVSGQDADPGESSATIRSWKAGSGQSVRGELISVVGNQVHLKLEDGRVLTPTLSQLATSERPFVSRAATRLAANGLRTDWSEEGVQIRSRASAWSQWIFAAESAIAIEDEVSEGGSFRFRTRSFDWTCDRDLSVGTKRDIARFFEGTMTLLRMLPGDLGNTAEEAGGRFQVNLGEKSAGQATSGAASERRSAYDFPGDVLGCTFQEAGVSRMGSEFVRDPHHQGEMLRRKLVLLALERAGLDYLPGWVVYGLCHYIAAVPQVDGVFLSRYVLEDLKKSCDENLRTLGKIEPFLALDSEDWAEESLDILEQKQSLHLASMAIVHYLLTESREEARDFAEMLRQSAEVAPAWNTYLAAVDAYQKKFEELKARPDVTVNEDGSLRLPPGVVAPPMPKRPEDIDQFQLPHRHTRIATGEREPRQFIAAVMLGVNDGFTQVPDPLERADLLSERHWFLDVGKSSLGTFAGIEKENVVLAVRGKPVRVPFTKLSPQDRELVAVHLKDWLAGR